MREISQKLCCRANVLRSWTQSLLTSILRIRKRSRPNCRSCMKVRSIVIISVPKPEPLGAELALPEPSLRSAPHPAPNFWLSQLFVTTFSQKSGQFELWKLACFYYFRFEFWSPPPHHKGFGATVITNYVIFCTPPANEARADQTRLVSKSSYTVQCNQNYHVWK